MFFDTQVQELKYKALKEVATLAWQDNLAKGLPAAAARIVPGPQPTMRCCIYKERAIMDERMQAGHGRRREQPQCHRGHQHRLRRVPGGRHPCEQTPAGAASPTGAMNACPKDAITIVEPSGPHRPRPSASSAAGASACAPTAPSSNQTRPCENACKVGAITHGRRQNGLHRQRQVHLLRRLRLPVPLRRHCG